MSGLLEIFVVEPPAAIPSSFVPSNSQMPSYTHALVTQRIPPYVERKDETPATHYPSSTSDTTLYSAETSVHTSPSPVLSSTLSTSPEVPIPGDPILSTSSLSYIPSNMHPIHLPSQSSSSHLSSFSARSVSPVSLTMH